MRNNTIRNCSFTFDCRYKMSINQIHLYDIKAEHVSKKYHQKEISEFGISSVARPLNSMTRQFTLLHCVQVVVFFNKYMATCHARNYSLV